MIFFSKINKNLDNSTGGGSDPGLVTGADPGPGPGRGATTGPVAADPGLGRPPPGTLRVAHTGEPGPRMRRETPRHWWTREEDDSDGEKNEQHLSNSLT